MSVRLVLTSKNLLKREQPTLEYNHLIVHLIEVKRTCTFEHLANFKFDLRALYLLMDGSLSSDAWKRTLTTDRLGRMSDDWWAPRLAHTSSYSS